MQKKIKLLQYIGSVLLALDLMFFFLSAAVIITLAFKPLYNFDVKHLKLEGQTGYKKEEIMDNYKELIDYNLFPSHKTLKFPTLPMSKEAEIHFQEVKVIFQNFMKFCILTGIIGIVGILGKRKRKEYGYLCLTGIMSITLPLILGILVAANWDWFFVTFHELMFHNDYWLFNPVTDPIILLLPDEFFMHCAIMILALVGISAVVCVGFGMYKKSEHIIN